MPGSGSETDAKPLVGQFSDYYYATVPIKKRRCPGFWPPPPPSEEQSSVTSVNENENSGLSQGPDSASASVSTSSGLSDVNVNMPCEEKVQTYHDTDVNIQQSASDLPLMKLDEPTLSSKSELPKVKVEATTITVKPAFSSNDNNAKKIVDAQSSSCSQLVECNSDLQLKAKKSDAVCEDKDIATESKIEGKGKQQVSASPGNIDLSLRLKDHLISDMARNNIEGSGRRLETFERDSVGPVSEGKFDVGTGSTIDGGHLPPNRSNWDLNVTMDAWEGTNSDASADGKVGGSLNEGSHSHSTRMVAANIASENIPVVPPLAGQICTSDSSLHLGLGLPLRNVIFSTGMSRPTVTVGNRGVGRHSIVKQEPIDEHYVKESESNRLRSVDLRTIKQESIERSNLHTKLPNISTSKLIAPALIKSETNESNNESQNLAGQHAVTSAMDIDDDFEDGEVRESERCAVTSNHACEERELEHESVNSDGKRKGFAVSALNYSSLMSHAEESENKQENVATENGEVEKVANGVLEEKNNDVSDRDTCLQIPPADATPNNGSEGKNLHEALLHLNTPAKSGESISMAIEKEKSSDLVNNVNCGPVTNILPRGDGTPKTDIEKNHLALPKEDTAPKLDSASKENEKDGIPGVSRSRIIHLPRSSNASSIRSLSGRSLQSPMRDRLPEMMTERDRVRPRGRGEGYISSGRRQDETFRTSRTNFVHSRGRISSRIDKVHEDWDAEYNVVPDCYKSHKDFRAPRHKYASGVGDTEIDYDYKFFSDAAFAGNRWCGRKLITDEAPIMDHLQSRRQSPGERESHGGQRFHMVRRVSRNISPSRCIGDDGSELVGMRQNQKFLRGCPEEDVGPMLTRPRPPYEVAGDHSVRGSRSFPSVRRRGPFRLRSRSPIRSRSRSPRHWCSPRRRSPDGFHGPPELPHRRSPMYRTERIRSPGRSCFPTEIVVRRHGSPPYTSRSSDITQEHSHQRSVINSRNPAERFLPGNGRRFDIVDSRERTECEEHFDESLHADRFQELGGDNDGDERRFHERRGGHTRSFRPPYRRKYHH